MMKHLSGMDAMFLHVESAEMPMHVGSLHVLDLPAGHSGEFFDQVKQYLSQRLHLVNVFTRKLVLIPFDLSNPVWVEDDDIDLDHHIRHITLPKPGSNRQLEQTVARLHSNLLDRSRPLWEIYIIDGLRSGQIGLYAKIHHAAIDGQAGVAVAKALFELTPVGRAIKPPRPRARRSTYPLGMAELAGAALRNTAAQYIKLYKLAPDIWRALKDVVLSRSRSPAADAGPAAGEPGPRKGTLRDLIPPRTMLNVAVTNQRSFAGRTVPVAEVKAIARHFGVSFNDVVMAVVSGALRRYLEEYNDLPAKSLTAAVPMSLRGKDDNSATNQVTFSIMHLATNTADPVARLKEISQSSTQRKSTMGRIKSAIPMDFPLFAAPWLVSGLASLYGRSRLADMLPPWANVVISNVAGVPVPLYFAGAAMACYYPVSIPGHGMALNVTVQSYNGRLDYGLIACRRAVPDLNDLGDYLLAEHRLLHDLTLAATTPESAAAEGVAGVRRASTRSSAKPAPDRGEKKPSLPRRLAPSVTARADTRRSQSRA